MPTLIEWPHDLLEEAEWPEPVGDNERVEITSAVELARRVLSPATTRLGLGRRGHRRTAAGVHRISGSYAIPAKRGALRYYPTMGT
jgi:hypothetical protein